MKKLNRTISVIFVLGIFIAFVSCQGKKDKEKADGMHPGMHTVSVLEVIPTTNYTYLKVFEENKDYWIAVPAMEAAKGDVLYYTQAMEMQQFESKELGRTFESVLFVSDISTTPIPANTMPAGASPQGKVLQPREPGLQIDQIEGGISIATLYASPEKFEGKEIHVTGKVVKFSPDIMSRNWVHIQDGTEHDGHYDLTITTGDRLATGDVETFRGIIRLNKDFGAGYRYDVIMEEAKVLDR
ncbi:MAG TPA: GW dipeptide domain-containing protein [Bacteroidales bacterium]|nr:GW dipeptide domain-containing protein [Bacteroidales bacterium]HSA43127.1 GW dipeptide domain-containing protein [Bacteroidales bacterium]